jgi:hypothetical protein
MDVPKVLAVDYYSSFECDPGRSDSDFSREEIFCSGLWMQKDFSTSIFAGFLNLFEGGRSEKTFLGELTSGDYGKLL